MSFKWTPKREEYCRQFIVDFNQTQAAIRAEYAPSGAGKEAHKLMQESEIQLRIAELMEARNERTETTADWVLQRLRAMADADIADVFDESNGLKPVKEWPLIWRQMATGLEVVELFEGRGDEREQIGLLKKMKTMRSEKLYDMLGKHVDVQAFKERVEVDATDKLAEALARARARVTGK